MTKQRKPPQKLSTLDKLIDAFNRLSEPVQVLLIIGFFLLVAWIVSNPDVLRGIIRALQLWWAVKTSFSYLQR